VITIRDWRHRADPCTVAWELRWNRQALGYQSRELGARPVQRADGGLPEPRPTADSDPRAMALSSRARTSGKHGSASGSSRPLSRKGPQDKLLDLARRRAQQLVYPEQDLRRLLPRRLAGVGLASPASNERPPRVTMTAQARSAITGSGAATTPASANAREAVGATGPLLQNLGTLSSALMSDTRVRVEESPATPVPGKHGLRRPRPQYLTELAPDAVSVGS